MKSIKFLFVLFAAIAFTAPTFAQRGDKDHRGHRGEGMKHLIEDLNLTDTQKGQAKELRQTYRTKMEALRDQNGDRSEKREEIHQLREEQEAAFRKILTAEQIATFDAKKAEKEKKKAAFKQKMKSVDKDAMREEMKAYKDKNIKPVLLEQRKKLEPSISAADRAEIKELRIAMKGAKKEIKAVKDKHKATRTDAPRGKREGSAARTGVQSIKDKYADKHKAAQALADKYDTQITALLTEVEGRKAQWDADMKAIKDKYFGDIKEEFGKQPRGEKSHKGKGKRGGHKARKGHDNEKVAFLLMGVNKGEKKGKRKKR